MGFRVDFAAVDRFALSVESEATSPAGAMGWGCVLRLQEAAGAVGLQPTHGQALCWLSGRSALIQLCPCSWGPPRPIEARDRDTRVALGCQTACELLGGARMGLMEEGALGPRLPSLPLVPCIMHFTRRTGR